MKQQLIKNLNDKSASIGIVGLGYVGIPMAIGYVEVGYKYWVLISIRKKSKK